VSSGDAEVQEIKTGVLVLGSEAAGAKAAIEAHEAGADVLVVTKGLVGRSGSTVMAGGGIQAPIDPRDNPDVFFEDVVKGGDYLNNQKLVERLVNLAASEVLKMDEWGAKFVKKNGKFVQYESPGATYPRSLLPLGMSGGIQWRRALVSQLKRLKIKVMQDVFITRFLLSDSQVAGVMGVSLRDGKFVVFRAKNTILATGGCPQVYRMTDASLDATGDGMVIAYHAGAELVDMEFQQFFPTCCYSPPYEMSNIPATLRYFIRGRFYNSVGEAFMERYMPLAKDWGLRDPTSRAIYLENMYGRGSPHGGAYLGINHLPENLIKDWIERERPAWLKKIEKMGIDIRREAIECGPACHYSMGGVRVNENCETSLPRLYAAGEVASGMDGAERIDAGPAITWCLTMGYITGRAAAEKAGGLDWLNVELAQVSAERERINLLRQRRNGVRGFEIKNKIKDMMWQRCALAREKKGLEEGLSLIQQIKSEDLPRICVPDTSPVFNRGLVEALEAMNMVELTEMIVRAALMREESRKSHYRMDFPEHDNDHWLKNIVIREDGGEMQFTTVPPVMTRMRPQEKAGM
jgi:succinate dehydrogenase/fumarate reductase flavoprotein subunit